MNLIPDRHRDDPKRSTIPGSAFAQVSKNRRPTQTRLF